MKYIFIQIFVQVDSHVDYAVVNCPELYCSGIRIQKIVLHCLYRLRTNYTWLNHLSIKIPTKDTLPVNEDFLAI